MSTTREPIPLVYILSNGRSGSTLLDLLLGAHPQVWSVGEAQILPWELRNDRLPCGCGLSVRKCPFWAAVVPRTGIGSGEYPIDHFRDEQGLGRVLRWSLLPDLWRGASGAGRGDAVAAYGEANARYLEAVREEATRRGRDVRWLVDASKDPYRLLWLHGSGLFDLRVIHLTKDPRAYVYSTARLGTTFRPGVVVRKAARWLVENGLCARLRARAFAPDHQRHLRYEDLAADPERVLSGLVGWLGLAPVEGTSRRFRDAENHCISGNEMRWRSDEIRLDERWRRALPSRHRMAVWALTWPLRGTFGYR